MDSAIQPDDYVHHGQGDNLLGHGREQGTQWLDEQRRNDPLHYTIWFNWSRSMPGCVFHMSFPSYHVCLICNMDNI